MLAAVAGGEGVALMPAHAAKIPHAGCVLIPITGTAPMTELLAVMPATGDVRAQSLVAVLRDRAVHLRDDP